jgi:hypothetical protein
MCDYGIAPDLVPIDEIDVWVHEFSERAVHLAIVDEMRIITKIPIAISFIPRKSFFRVPHLLVSLHTISILRIKNIQETIDERLVLTPDAFENLLIFKGESECTEISNQDPTKSFMFY